MLADRFGSEYAEYRYKLCAGENPNFCLSTSSIEVGKSYTKVLPKSNMDIRNKNRYRLHLSLETKVLSLIFTIVKS